MKNETDNFFRNESINIIEMKNVIAIVAIVVLLITLYYNDNEIKERLGRSPSLNRLESHKLNIGISLSSVIIIAASVYICVREYLLEQNLGTDTTGNKLKILAFSISFISTLILLYVILNFNDLEEELGTEPIV